MKLIRAVLVILSLTCFGTSQTSQVVVKSGSMEPNINIGDLLIVDQAYYTTKPIKRFDVVSFRHPGGFKAVARVVGLAGESIRIRKNQVFINGKKQKEPFKIIPCPNAPEEVFPCADFGSFKIPKEEYFLLADNRGESQDSRIWEGHTIRRSEILGKVTKVVLQKTQPNNRVNWTARSELRAVALSVVRAAGYARR